MAGSSSGKSTASSHNSPMTELCYVAILQYYNAIQYNITIATAVVKSLLLPATTLQLQHFTMEDIALLFTVFIICCISALHRM